MSSEQLRIGSKLPKIIEGNTTTHVSDTVDPPEHNAVGEAPNGAEAARGDAMDIDICSEGEKVHEIDNASYKQVGHVTELVKKAILLNSRLEKMIRQIKKQCQTLASVCKSLNSALKIYNSFSRLVACSQELLSLPYDTEILDSNNGDNLGLFEEAEEHIDTLIKTIQAVDIARCNFDYATLSKYHDLFKKSKGLKSQTKKLFDTSNVFHAGVAKLRKHVDDFRTLAVNLRDYNKITDATSAHVLGQLEQKLMGVSNDVLHMQLVKVAHNAMQSMLSSGSRSTNNEHPSGGGSEGVPEEYVSHAHDDGSNDGNGSTANVESVASEIAQGVEDALQPLTEKLQETISQTVSILKTSRTDLASSGVGGTTSIRSIQEETAQSRQDIVSKLQDPPQGSPSVESSDDEKPNQNITTTLKALNDILCDAWMHNWARKAAEEVAFGAGIKANMLTDTPGADTKLGSDWPTVLKNVNNKIIGAIEHLMQINRIATESQFSKDTSVLLDTWAKSSVPSSQRTVVENAKPSQPSTGNTKSSMLDVINSVINAYWKKQTDPSLILPEKVKTLFDAMRNLSRIRDYNVFSVDKAGAKDHAHHMIEKVITEFNDGKIAPLEMIHVYNACKDLYKAFVPMRHSTEFSDIPVDKIDDTLSKVLPVHNINNTDLNMILGTLPHDERPRNHGIAAMITTSMANSIKQMQITQATIRVITTVVKNNNNMQHDAMCPSLMWNSQRNDLYAQFSRLVVMEVIMWRRLNGLRQTYASDHKRLATEYNLTLLEFRNANFKHMEVSPNKREWFVLDSRTGKSTCFASRALSDPLPDVHIRLAGHPCVMQARDTMWQDFMRRIK